MLFGVIKLVDHKKIKGFMYYKLRLLVIYNITMLAR